MNFQQAIVIEKFIEKIDWELLQKQKIELINFNSDNEICQQLEELSGEVTESLDGIINLIENLQDLVVELGYKTEEEVFGKSNDE